MECSQQTSPLSLGVPAAALACIVCRLFDLDRVCVELYRGQCRGWVEFTYDGEKTLEASARELACRGAHPGRDAAEPRLQIIECSELKLPPLEVGVLRAFWSESEPSRLDVTGAVSGMESAISVQSVSAAFYSLWKHHERSPGVRQQLLELTTRAARLEAVRRGTPGQTRLPEKDIWSAFERAALSEPLRPALVCGSKHVSYATVRHLSLWIAAELRRRGTPRGALVPALVPDGPHVIAIALGCLRAHCPFVFLDAAWPSERTTALLAGHPNEVVLCFGESAKDVEPGRRLVVPSLLGDIPPIDEIEPYEEPAAEAIAYGFFTSGSTGLPKCTLNVHRGLRNRFANMDQRFPIRASDRVLQNSRHVFDSSLWQYLWPLTRGASVVVRESAEALDVRATLAEISAHAVAMTDFVPSLFNLFVTLLRNDSDLAGMARSLKYLLIGGERMNGQAVQSFRRMLPHVEIWNTYGPTEAAIGMVFHRVEDGDTGEIPLGRCLDNTYLAVCDRHGQMVPPGVVGEARIGGDCLGLGYFRDPQRTAKAFVPNTIEEIPGTILYRTGDMVVQDASGLIHFRGRRDEQVKVNGVRLELGEIEHALLSCPSVAEAKACVLNLAPGEPAGLVAAVVTVSSADESSVRRELAARLPGEMMPKQLVVVECMPLTHNGKLDARGLGQLIEERRLQSCTDAAPFSGVEAEVAAIFAQVLGHKSFGRTTEFGSAGGDSLLSVQMMLSIQKKFAVELPTQTFDRACSVASLTKAVRCEEAPPRALDAPVLAFEEFRGRVAELGPFSRTVLVTGATGYIGRRVLDELIRQPRARAIAFVRRADKLGKYDPSLVQVVEGDLSQPGWGVSERDYEELFQRVDSVVHCAGAIALGRDYLHHSSMNVNGLVSLLHFCAGRRAKALHFISTLGIEEGWSAPPTDGYLASKLVGETLIAECEARGLDACIYKVGEASPAIADGCSNPRSFVHSLIEAALELGLCPATEAAFDAIPVDILAQIIVRNLDRSPRPRRLRLTDIEPVRIVDVIRMGLGQGCKQCSSADFYLALQAACEGQRATRAQLLSYAVWREVTHGHVKEGDTLARIVRPHGDTADRMQGALELARLGFVHLSTLHAHALHVQRERLARTTNTATLMHATTT